MSEVLLLVECLQGTGELTQARQLARELLKRNIHVTVATSSGLPYFKDLQEKAGEKASLLHIVELPPLTFNAHTGEYEVPDTNPDQKTPLFNPTGGFSEKGQQTLNTRRDIILKQLKDTHANVICASGWPFWLGEDILDTEMHAVLDATRNTNQHCTLVTRDVLNADSPMTRGAHKTISACFSQNPKLHWLVLGDEKTIPLPPPFLNDCNIDNTRLTYVGFGEKVHPAASSKNSPSNNIVVSPGGGDFRYSSFNILRMAVAAATDPSLKEKQWTLITGKNYKDHQDELAILNSEIEKAQAMGAHIEVKQQMPPDEFQHFLLKQKPTFIGQSGIGLTNDILKYRLNSLLIPINSTLRFRSHEGSMKSVQFDEQLVRATTLSEAGLVAMLNPQECGMDINHKLLTIPLALNEAFVKGVHKAIKLEPDFKNVKTNGFEEAAQILLNPQARHYVNRASSRIERT